ncbi:MAG TPA: M28 family metallopeptidase [Bryobacteraceae bacterium]|nr:M28 family metallopeptidase [Bryobacteraceae bacterium]
MKKTSAVAVFLLLSSCTQTPEATLQPAFDAISPDSLLSGIKTLASDEFEGRKPGSPGEEKTVAYLEQQFRQMGLKPGNPDGTYVQKVPLAGTASQQQGEFVVAGKKLPAQVDKDFVAVSTRFVPATTVKNSDIVFVGYGVVAPEYGWDDYKGVDVTGKTIVMLVNDPQIPDPADPSKLDPNMFRGKAMTYYGRWTYKYEIASEKGAAAAIIVHETPLAGYGFEVVVSGKAGEMFDIQRPNNNMARVPVEGWMTYDKTAELFRAAGLDLAAAKKEALKKDFRPIPLKGATASFSITNTLRKADSRNVIAKLEGSDPALKDEYLIYTAHWDHFGRNTELQGDQIMHGAIDNASGTAGLLELARAYTKLSPAPKRSVLFLSVTGEEQGLLGAEYYAENPLYPLKKTLANINMDELNVWGKTKDLVIVGLGNSELDDIVTEVLRERRRTPVGDAEPEKGFYYRSDHFQFAKKGVPALDPEGGIEFIGKPEGWGRQKRDEFNEKIYHKPADKPDPAWDLSGAVDDLRVLLAVGYRVVQSDRYPEWKQGNEFKARRDAMMKQ